MAGDTDRAIQSSGTASDAVATILPLPSDGAPSPARKAKRAAAATTQAEPTAPRAIDAETGLELDVHGLPTSGPARRRWLAEAGINDPALADAGINDPALIEAADELENDHG